MIFRFLFLSTPLDYPFKLLLQFCILEPFILLLIFLFVKYFLLVFFSLNLLSISKLNLFSFMLTWFSLPLAIFFKTVAWGSWLWRIKHMWGYTFWNKIQFTFFSFSPKKPSWPLHWRLNHPSTAYLRCLASSYSSVYFKIVYVIFVHWQNKHVFLSLLIKFHLVLFSSFSIVICGMNKPLLLWSGPITMVDEFTRTVGAYLMVFQFETKWSFKEFNYL